MGRLQIGNDRERALVAGADFLLRAATAGTRPFAGRIRPRNPRRILLLRLERIGDLLMALPAIRDVRQHAPDAEIDLVVGAWNAPLAATLSIVDRVQSLSVTWLAREGEGAGIGELLRTAWGWRRRRYDLAINFEPDVRSNLLLAVSGASWKAGWFSGGGGPLLNTALEFDPREHTTTNAQRLVSAVFGRDASPASTKPLILLPESAIRAVDSLLPRGARGPLVGLHVSGGRAVKQWDPARFREVARRLVVERNATIVLTGAPADRPLVDIVKAGLNQSNVVDVAGRMELTTLAALLHRLSVFISGDTGPMHLAHAVGTPLVAVFGPSDPGRYAPSGALDRIVHANLPCRPCNRIRTPPRRCTGHTPECLTAIPVDIVVRAATDVLNAREAEIPRSSAR